MTATDHPEGTTTMSTLTATHAEHGTVELIVLTDAICHRCVKVHAVTYDQAGMFTSAPTCTNCMTALGWTLSSKEVN